MCFHDSDEALQNSLSVILTVCVQEIQEHIMHNSVCTAYTHCKTYKYYYMYASLNTAQLYPLTHSQGGYNSISSNTLPGRIQQYIL